jgi:hypothetical protein
MKNPLLHGMKKYCDSSIYFTMFACFHVIQQKSIIDYEDFKSLFDFF